MSLLQSTFTCSIFLSNSMIMFVFWFQVRNCTVESFGLCRVVILAQMFPNQPDANQKRISCDEFPASFEDVHSRECLLLESIWGAARRYSTESWDMCTQHYLVRTGRTPCTRDYIELSPSRTAINSTMSCIPFIMRQALIRRRKKSKNMWIWRNSL